MRPIADRFWPKVDVSGDCWVWTACRDSRGYGRMSYPGRGSERAHRIAWELAYGDVPTGMCVLHHCDNPRCVRPEHLFLGDRDANNKDKVAKGRHRVPIGDDHWSRARPANLARGDANGARQHPDRILRGDDHPFRQNPSMHARGERTGDAKLTSEIVSEIRRRYVRRKVTAEMLAAEYGVHPSTIRRVLKGKYWSHVP